MYVFKSPLPVRIASQTVAAILSLSARKASKKQDETIRFVLFE